MQYLHLLLGPIKELSERYALEFVVISNENPRIDMPNFRFLKWNKETEIDDLNTFDIGVMPLVEDHWSSGKCGFKALQYLAIGIPTILSPIGVNNSIVKHGVEGFFANSPNEWKTSLEELISNSALRHQMGQHGRKTILEKYSVLSQNEKYRSLFKN